MDDRLLFPPDDSHIPKLTWAKCKIMDPRLFKLYKRAKQYKPESNFCANGIWYPYLKPVLCHLVGWDAQNEELRSCQAYDICYDIIYKQLPDCTHEGLCFNHTPKDERRFRKLSLRKEDL